MQQQQQRQRQQQRQQSPRLAETSEEDHDVSRTPSGMTREETRRLLQLEQTIRTRALIDDMVNSLE